VERSQGRQGATFLQDGNLEVAGRAAGWLLAVLVETEEEPLVGSRGVALRENREEVGQEGSLT